MQKEKHQLEITIEDSSSTDDNDDSADAENSAELN